MATVQISDREYQQLKNRGGLAGDVGELAGAAVAGLAKPNRMYRQELRKDMAKLRSGDLGLSQAERQQFAADAARQAGAAQQVQSAELARLTKSDPSMTGKALQAQGDIAEAGALARSSAAKQASSISAQLAQTRRDAIMGRMQQQAMQNKALGGGVGRSLGAAARGGGGGGSTTAGLSDYASAVLGK